MGSQKQVKVGNLILVRFDAPRIGTDPHGNAMRFQRIRNARDFLFAADISRIDAKFIRTKRVRKKREKSKARSASVRCCSAASAIRSAFL